jgi:hypothetical protein
MYLQHMMNGCPFHELRNYHLLGIADTLVLKLIRFRQMQFIEPIAKV